MDKETVKNTSTYTKLPESDSPSCQGYSHDDMVMGSVGVVDMDCPNYTEEDDVKDSIAEGYF